MPVSKHRRKKGGKSVRHPGRLAPPRATSDGYRRFLREYIEPFERKWPDHAAVRMLDLVCDVALILESRDLQMAIHGFQPASKRTLLEQFVARDEVEIDDGVVQIVRTHDDAEAALNFLVEEEMIVVAGDLVSIHPRFDHLARAA